MTTIDATVAKLMGRLTELVHAESHLASGPLIWGKAYDEKKAPIFKMHSDFEITLRAALTEAQPVQPTGCACKWNGELSQSRCELHEAWHVAILEWSDRAKIAEAKLAQPVPIAPLQGEPVACKGKNCGSTDGRFHSADCFAEYEKTIGRESKTEYCTFCETHVTGLCNENICPIDETTEIFHGTKAALTGLCIRRDNDPAPSQPVPIADHIPNAGQMVEPKALSDAELCIILLGIDCETKRLPPGFRRFARAIEQAHGIGAQE